MNSRLIMAALVLMGIAAPLLADVQINIICKDTEKAHGAADIIIQTSDKKTEIDSGSFKAGAFTSKKLPVADEKVCITIYPREKDDAYWGVAKSFTIPKNGPLVIKLKHK